MEVESGEALGEAPMRVGAELREQEAETPAQFPPPRTPARWRALRASGDDTALLELFLV